MTAESPRVLPLEDPVRDELLPVPRLIVTFFGVVALGILMVGYLFNLIM